MFRPPVRGFLSTGVMPSTSLSSVRTKLRWRSERQLDGWTSRMELMAVSIRWTSMLLGPPGRYPVRRPLSEQILHGSQLAINIANSQPSGSVLGIQLFVLPRHRVHPSLSFIANWSIGLGFSSPRFTVIATKSNMSASVVAQFPKSRLLGAVHVQHSSSRIAGGALRLIAAIN